MFRKRNGMIDTLRCEICGVVMHLKRLIPAIIAGAALIIISWMYFGGPCRVTMFFRIPGGGITIAAYYIFWLIFFALAGGECVLIITFGRRCRGNRVILFHVAAHMCLLLWYPLFFTAFAQFLALLIIIAAIVLLILEAKEAVEIMCLLPVLCCIKAAILVLFAYVNLAFLIIN